MTMWLLPYLNSGVPMVLKKERKKKRKTLPKRDTYIPGVLETKETEV